MARLAWYLNLAAFVFVAAGADTSTNYRQERQSDDPNIFGVASVARVTSRNGRISSSGGVHFYPGPGATNDYYTSVANQFPSDYYSPVTFAKAIDGKYASGSIQIRPGALGVSSSAQAGYVQGNWPMDWQRQWQWPGQSQLYVDPWSKVKLETPSLRRQWMYPSFNPFFNFWR